MRIRGSIPCLLLSLWATVGAWAGPSATAEQLSVRLAVPPAQLYPGQQFKAGLYFKLEPGWHVYWLNAGDSGQPPSIKWQLPAGISAGALEFPAPRRLPLGPLMDYGYENEVLFPVPVQVAADFRPTSPSVTLGAAVKWLVCREVCIPGSAELSVERAALGAAPALPTTTEDGRLLTRFENAVPAALPVTDQARFTSIGTKLVLAVTTGRRESSAQFFPADQNLIANAAPQVVQPLADGLQLTLVKDENLTTAPQELRGVVVLAGERAYEIRATPGALVATPARPAQNLASIALLAFLGGIILNLMPCVFPVLFIKALALVKSSHEEQQHLRAHSLVYTLGVLLSFWAIVAVLLVLRGAGHQLGWGFQFQSPGFVVVIALLLFFLGLSLAGQFEIGLTLAGAGSGLASRSGYTGSFFTGVLAVIVATPCTAPLMGAAVGYALASSAAVTFVVFTALALGLAAPYLLLSFYPAWTRVLPRPGAWMELLRQATAIPVFATVIWLVWVYDQSVGATGLIALLSAFLLLAIVGWVLGRWPARATATAAAVLVAALAVGLPLLAVRWAAPAAPATAPSSGSVHWEAFTPARVAHYRAEGRAVFVDFTASWCLSCQVNERLVLSRQDVQQRLLGSGVALIRADWTRQDEVIAQTLASLGRSGVPTYVIYPADPDAAPRILPEVLTPGIIEDALARLSPARAAASGSAPQVQGLFGKVTSQH
jgi:thiol:disulfide interchange protein